MKPPDPKSGITPEAPYLNRRFFMKSSLYAGTALTTRDCSGPSGRTRVPAPTEDLDNPPKLFINRGHDHAPIFPVPYFQPDRTPARHVAPLDVGGLATVNALAATSSNGDRHGVPPALGA